LSKSIVAAVLLILFLVLIAFWVLGWDFVSAHEKTRWLESPAGFVVS
jgi:hypothetical protein